MALAKFRVGQHVTSARGPSARFDGVISVVLDGRPGGHPVGGWWYRIRLDTPGPRGQTDVTRAERTLADA